ncbi:hypothetical protein Tco_0744179 [Tanacetum coccineum]
MDYLLWNDMKIMFELHVKDEVWKLQNRYKVLEWKLYDSCRVHFLRMQSMQIYMLVEKKYPLTPPTLSMMLEKKLQIYYESEMAYQLLIMEQLVKPMRHIQDFDELKDHCPTLKNTSYPHQRYAVYNTLVNEDKPTIFTSIRRIHQEDMAYPCLHFTDNHEGLKTQYAVKMDDLDITIGEYILIEEEKACRRGHVYNWETATYGRIWYDEDVHYLRSFEKEFPAIVYNDALTCIDTAYPREPSEDDVGGVFSGI